MAISGLANLVRVSVSNTPGTGAFTLSTALTGFRGASVLTNATQYSYLAREGTSWEIGRATYTSSGTSLARGVLESSNSNSLVSFTSAVVVSITILAQDITDLAAAKIDSTAVLGKQALWVPAAAMVSRTTAGAAAGTVETSSNRVMIKTLDFDTSTVEYAQFSIRMPKSWNESTVTFVPVWSHASTSTNFGVVWSLAGIAFGDSDAMDTARGTAQTSTDTGGTTNDVWIGPESSAITIGGTPQEGDLVVFEVSRVTGNGSDTMAIDARLHGIVLFVTINAGNDA